jgi:hypothetical protein
MPSSRHRGRACPALRTYSWTVEAAEYRGEGCRETVGIVGLLDAGLPKTIAVPGDEGSTC